MTARHIPDNQIAPPERTADGTGARRYQPLPGDLAELRSGAGPAHVHGVRLVRVTGEVRGHGADENDWWVRASGELEDWHVDSASLTLVWRRPPESTP